MPRRRSMRYHQRPDSDDEFETPALQIAAEQNNAPVGVQDESDDDLQSESGLGESPEEDLIEDEGQSSDEDNNKNDNAESDSDSAPEEVSFARSREAEEKRQQTIKGEILKGRKEEKERRRKRDELFKLQKKGKLVALNKRKLPEELLEELSQQQEKKQKADQDKKDAEEDKEEGHSDEEGEEEEEEDEDLASDSEEELDGWDKPESLDFIPLGDVKDERLAVVSLKGQRGHDGAITQSAADFKQAMLYGGRHKRVTSQQVRKQQAKRQARR